MKAILLSVLFAGVVAHATDTSVKVNNIDSGTEDTTISIKKGSNVTNKKVYTLSEGTEDITGDKDVLKKTAEQNWKKACADFKTEFKEMNKDNKIVSLSCGTMTCTKEGVESTCQSTAKHKVRVLSEE
jgi:hypothetical protein